MPKLRFVREMREVDAAPGETILDAAGRAGIVVARGFWELMPCRSGFCGACRVWVEPPRVTPPKFWERRKHKKLLGRRLACQCSATGDCDVTTMP